MLNTLVLSYSSSSAVYDFPSYHRHHDRWNTSVYACYFLQVPSTRFTRQAEMESPSPHLHSSACCDKKSRQTENTDAMAESHSWRPESWLGWAGGCDWFHGHVSSCHANKERWPPPRARMSGTRRDVPADCCRGAWMVLGRSGAEWRETPMQDRTVGGWASRG